MTAFPEFLVNGLIGIAGPCVQWHSVTLTKQLDMRELRSKIRYLKILANTCAGLYLLLTANVLATAINCL